MPGGVSHEYRFDEDYPIYITAANGSRKWDVEGREYIDFNMGSASLLLGHGHPDVVAAIHTQADVGIYYSNMHPLEVEWASQVQSLIPSAELVRFTGSGTEATLLALRLARAYSGKERILRVEGHYHGWHDFALRGTKWPYDELPSLGIPDSVAPTTVVVPPDLNAIEKEMAKGEAAGIIFEPSGANWGCVPLQSGFHQGLRQLADRYGVVLMFDEVITGFRWSPGGAQATLSVTPDLTTLAKIVTGGLPGGALVGRKEFMRLLDPSVEFRGRRPAIVHQGTFNGHPLVAAAAIATLKHVSTGEPQKKADALAERTRRGLRRILSDLKIGGVVYGASSTFHVYFGEVPSSGIAALSAQQIRSVPKNIVTAIRHGLRNHGIEFMSYLGGVTSSAHTEADIDVALKAYRAVLERLVAERVLDQYVK